MRNLKMLSLQQFVASESTPGPELHQLLISHYPQLQFVPLPHIHVFAGEFVMYERHGKFWPIAWWYPEVGYTTRAQALDSLYDWFLQWAE